MGSEKELIDADVEVLVSYEVDLKEMTVSEIKRTESA